MNQAEISFDLAFEALTDHTPLRWQRRLFNRFYAGNIPQTCNVPTGLGKTSVIPIWLIAISRQADEGNITLPRRLVYVINRRTVVDQATSMVEQVRERVLRPQNQGWVTHENALRSIAHSLHSFIQEPPLLAVSTLRGELADNEEWKQDPARAAIIVGTIDMIGSKLLFSGYGDGQYNRAHHAGLMGQDVLIVHDEAHLTPAFSDLLRGVESEQRKGGEARPVSVMELSATQRPSEETGDSIQLAPDDERDSIVTERLDATKLLRLHECGTRKNAVKQIVDLAFHHNDSQDRVLIYVRTPKDAQEVEEKLRKALKSDHRTALLTGTIRGYERDILATDNTVYRHFLHREGNPLSETVYLVSTSAGEVGIDIDADHMVCDVTTLDSLIQRLGRVNRRGGEGRTAQIDLVWTSDDENERKHEATAKTLDILRCWIHEALRRDSIVNASPRSVRQLVDGLEEDDLSKSFSPKPSEPPLSDFLLDAWSLTSINDMSGRPGVAEYLHGLTNDPPTTYVAWRKELALFCKYDVDEKTMSDWFASCPIRTNERLQIRTDVLRGMLTTLNRKHRQNGEDQQFQVVLLDAYNRAQWFQLSQLGEREAGIEYKTVVLPTWVGGLNQHGMLDPSELRTARDVADSDTEGRRRERWLYMSGKKSPLISENGLGNSWAERERITLASNEDAGAEGYSEGAGVELALRMPVQELATSSPEYARMRQSLTEHTDSIVRSVQEISERLLLEPGIASALVCAAQWHDQGKDRVLWQKFARNNDCSNPVAKSRNYLHGRMLAGYRHEFGSLLDAMRDPSVRRNPEYDLILHLIAAHHGHARPCFDRRAFDRDGFSTSENLKANIEVMQRFERLQRRFGRWGLAWLESLLRCADAQASRARD